MTKELPDFERIAWRVIEDLNKQTWDGSDELNAVRVIIEQLRQVWNARGAVDIAKVNGSLLTGNVPKLVDAIRELDR